jgi:tetratricopeptide (TPR) repeat protein
MKNIYFLFVLLSFPGIAKSQQENLQELLNQKQYNRIVSYANQLQAADSSDWQTMYLIGQAYEGLLRYRDAYRFYQHCLSLDSTQHELLYTTARVAANLGKVEDAESYFLKVWETDTTDFYANYQLARFHVQIGNDERAINYYEYLLESEPDNPVLLRAVGDCYYRLNDRFNAAEAYWFAFQNNKENAGLASTLINTLLHFEDRIDYALDVCDTALFYNSGNQKLLQNKATALFTGKQYARADSMYTFLLAQGDSSYQTVKYGGFSRYYAGKFMDAIELMEKAYMEDSTAIDICLFLGSTLGRTYDRKRAYLLFDQVERFMQPEQAIVNLLMQFRAETYYRDNRFREASALYYQLWSAGPKSDLLSGIWHCLGYANVSQLKDDDERGRSMFANVLFATERDKYQHGDRSVKLMSVRDQLVRFREEMFFRGMTEHPMIAPDNKRSTISETRLQELIQQLSENLSPS